MHLHIFVRFFLLRSSRFPLANFIFQVVLSGPSGFVFYVETILAEMGVPPAAIVLLD